MPESYHGYSVRQPFGGEKEYFRNAPEVAGMAAADGKIVLNPYSRNTPEQQKAVARNEAIRLWMREHRFAPEFDITPEQEKGFAGTEYSKPENRLALKHTILSRILTGDPSAGKATPVQRKWAEWVGKRLPK